jgi:hypothetical protein
VDNFGQLSAVRTVAQIGQFGQIVPVPTAGQVGQIVPLGHFLYQRHTKDILDHRPFIQESPSESHLMEKSLNLETQDTERSVFDTSKINLNNEPYVLLTAPPLAQEPNYYVIADNEENKKFKRKQEKKAENHDSGKKSSELKKNSKQKTVEKSDKTKNSDGQRVEFQMHGHDGPKSYKFGYDTGDQGGYDSEI